MTPFQLKRVRGVLASLGAGLVGIVAWGLYRPGHDAPAVTPGPTPSEAPPPPGVQRLGGFHYVQHKGDRVSFVLDAQSMTGQQQQEVQLRGVTMTFPYLARGEEGNATVSSDECVYSPGPQKAVFQGHVLVKTQDGGELTSDSLVYRGDKGMARTDAPAQFKRKLVSGSSTGLLYDSETGEVRFLADANMRIEDSEGGLPLEMHGSRAVLKREEGIVRFDEDVSFRQGETVLTADSVILTFDTADESLLGASATGSVQLNAPGGGPTPGVPGSGKGKGRGPRILKSGQLYLVFQDARRLRAATATPDAELTILPGPGEPRERRLLKARILTFNFDDAGRLKEVAGQKDASFVTDTLPPTKGSARILKCRRFVATIDPETGETKTIDFTNNVEITQGTQRSTSEKAWYNAAKSRLILEKGPQVLDLEDGSRLLAHDITIGTVTGSLLARGNVRHQLGRKTRWRPGLLSHPDVPTIVTSGIFQYEAATHQTRYLERALLRSGKDELRAPWMRVKEDRAHGGSRRLLAGDGVVSLFHPKESPGKPPPLPVETRAKEFVYDDAKSVAVYSGDVVMRQGDIGMKSPVATVTLTPDGATIQTVVAGEPVEIQQLAKLATGQRATYTPAAETLVLVGDKVVLKDPTQEVHGRSLTFHVGASRILVDGREEVRTETILKKETPKP